jgi:glutamine synthetase
MKPALTLPQLEKLIREGGIDTVLIAFPDHLGRLMGKRVTGSYFLDHLAKDGMEACDYLLTVDMEMNPQPGFRMASWDEGYGDFQGKLDPTTLRLIPWLPGTALGLVDLQWHGGRPVDASPRAMLRKQIERAAKAGYTIYMGSELEFYLFEESHEDLFDRNFADPQPTTQYIIDYHILGTTRDESVIRDIRNSMNRAGIPVEFSKGEWGRGQHEINLLYSDALTMADRHAIYKNGVKEIAWAHGRCATFMAKYSAAEAGSSCHIHTSVYNKAGKSSLFWDARKKEPSKVFRQFLGGLMKYSPELFLFFASTVNSYKRYQAGTFAPTNVAWSQDNRTTGFRIVGHGQGYRIENRMPGADANPYLAYAATIAAGLAGIEEGLDCGRAYKGDAYKDAKLPRVPTSLNAAADAFARSSLARSAFGQDVVDHYVHLSRLEEAAFRAAVTDWERVRYFDRI